ncbi:MAG: prolyl oligopeptidase family serine peptidase [Ruminococcus sp.]|nr:prolyl oligopeptidase family serine peptidase [Ruminococcus sp.]
MKKLLATIISLFLILLTACSNEVADIDFMTFNTNPDIFNISKVDLPYKLNRYCKSYSFDYSVDGVLVEGYISIPNNSSVNTPSKCILYNRGGNCNIGFLTDTDTAKICAETSRIVIASQYRANDEFGGEDLKDVLKLIDFCESFDFADMRDFTVAGVSRGGMMSYMAAREDNRIKRIISISGVSDLAQAYKDRDDMKKLLNNFIGGSPESKPEEYEKRSAVSWTDEITVPTLIIHSTGDQQVSYSQAESLYEKLLENGTDVTLKTYTDSTHGLHPEDLAIITDWLE